MKENSAMQSQVGGDHYKKLAIQPMEYAFKNHLDPLQFSVVKYVTRFRDKAGKQDLEKAKHCLDKLIEMEYGAFDQMKTNPVSIKPKEKAKLILFLESGELVSGFYYNEMWYYDQLSINSDGGVYSTILNSYKGHGIVGWIYANAK